MKIRANGKSTPFLRLDADGVEWTEDNKGEPEKKQGRGKKRRLAARLWAIMTGDVMATSGGKVRKEKKIGNDRVCSIGRTPRPVVLCQGQRAVLVACGESAKRCAVAEKATGLWPHWCAVRRKLQAGEAKNERRKGDKMKRAGRKK